MSNHFYSLLSLSHITSIQQATPLEIDAYTADSWSTYFSTYSNILSTKEVASAGSAGKLRQIIRNIEGITGGRVDICDVDLAMLWAQCKLSLGSEAEAIDIYNQVYSIVYICVYICIL